MDKYHNNASVLHEIHRQYTCIDDWRLRSNLRIFLISLMLFILSICFVIIMDLLFLKIPLQESLDNILIPFSSMMKQEMIIISLIILYSFAKPVFAYYRKKK